MTGEDRLATLIRAQLDHETREIVAPSDLAERIITARRPRSRTRRWRLHLSVALACAVALATVGAVRLLVDDLSSERGQAATKVTITPFNPNNSVKIGYLPPGVVESPETSDRGFVQDRPRIKTARGTVTWRADYATRTPVPGVPSRGIAITVTQSGSTFEALRPKYDFKEWRPLDVPTGRAEGGSEPAGAGTKVRLFIWEVRPRLFITLLTVGLSGAEAVKVLRGITVAE